MSADASGSSETYVETEPNEKPRTARKTRGKGCRTAGEGTTVTSKGLTLQAFNEVCGGGACGVATYNRVPTHQPGGRDRRGNEKFEPSRES